MIEQGSFGSPFFIKHLQSRYKYITYLIGNVFVVGMHPQQLRKNAQMSQCKLAIHVNNRWVPCGRCMACRVNKASQWTSRIMMETVTAPITPYFVTFTYNEKHLPEDGSLEKKKFHQWLKDQQKKELPGPIRYYAVGEYGDDSFRPHYHLAIFPETVEQARAFTAGWRKGFTQISEMAPARARYLAGYAAKKLTKAGDPRLCGREPEFRSSSRNPPLGARMVERIIATWKTPKMQEELKKRGDVNKTWRLDGKTYPIGDWALKKIRTELGIPLTEEARIQACPTYFDWDRGKEPINDPEAHRQWMEMTKIKKQQGRYRGRGEKI